MTNADSGAGQANPEPSDQANLGSALAKEARRSIVDSGGSANVLLNYNSHSQAAALFARQLNTGNRLVTMGDSQEKGPTSLYIFEENNFIRLKTRAIIENSFFEWTVLATIIANCVALAMEAHLPNNDKTELAIQIVSIFIFGLLS